jgi:hypothetical protein
MINKLGVRNLKFAGETKCQHTGAHPEFLLGVGADPEAIYV